MNYFNISVYNTVTERTDFEFNCYHEDVALDGFKLLFVMLRGAGGQIKYQSPRKVVISNYVLKAVELPIVYQLFENDKLIYCGNNPSYTIDLSNSSTYTVKRYPESFIEETGADWDIDIRIL